MDVHNKKQRSYNMSQIKGRDTKPEIRLRKALWEKGLRGYWLKSKIMGKPDIMFNKAKVAIFIDGCFWHKCPKCFTKPITNSRFWKKKIDGNVERDKFVTKTLRKQGWKVIRFWEHEVMKSLEKTVIKVDNAINTGNNLEK